MAQIVIAAGCSHGPSVQGSAEAWPKLGEKDKRDPRFDFNALVARAKPGLEAEITPEVQAQRHGAARAALSNLTQRLVDARLDVIVVISNSHIVPSHAQRPVFSLLRGAQFPARESTGATFDPNAPSQPQGANGELSLVPGSPDLATHAVEALNLSGFDVGCIDNLPEGTAIDEAFAFCYKWLLGGAIVPMIPLYLSRDLPNQPTPQRCVHFGAALRDALTSFPQDIRIGLIASGGLSHQIVDEHLDRNVVDILSTGQLDRAAKLDRAQINGAPGTPEVLNWLVVGGAMQPGVMELLAYEPCYRSLAGTGHGFAAGVWQPVL